MDTEAMDDFFSDFSEGMLALVSGIAIIITITFFIYEIIPLFSDEPMVFTFSIFSLIVCVAASISFYLSDITLLPDVVGKLITGLSITIFAVILFHIGNSYGISALPEVVLIGLLGFVSALTLSKGVLIPLFGEQMIVEPSEDVEENFDDTSETEDGIDEGKIEYGIEDEIEEPEETESLPQDDGPW